MTPNLDHLDYTDLEVLAEISRLTSKVITSAGGRIPSLADPEWITASPLEKIASLLCLAQAYLVADPHQIAAGMLKDAARDLSGARDWAAASALPSHTELARRRAQPGPLAQTDHRVERATLRHPLADPVR